MQPKTEELLNFLLWTADQLTQPTFRNLTESYESHAYRNGLIRQLKFLTTIGFVEADGKSPTDRLYRLTERGRLHTLGGRDPSAQWARAWDGRWRLVLFDVPTRRDVHRVRLRRYLRASGFGCLQGSVWVTPDPMRSEAETLSGGEVNAKSLLLLEARPCSGESDQDIVAGAWDFAAINDRYARHLGTLDQHPKRPLHDNSAARKLQKWASQERAAWLAAVQMDPLLPKRLLPPDYLGRRAWQRRIEVLRKAGEQLRKFNAVRR